MPFDTPTEIAVRISAFIAIFALIALLELKSPRRHAGHAKPRRWLTNLAILALGSTLVRLLALAAVPLVAIAAADFAATHEIGLLHWLRLPSSANVVLAIVVLDLAVWLQHVASHRIPLLWRLHRMHHSDTEFDLTTAIRFHPIEIGLSMLWKAVCVLVLGAPAIAVLIFEIILNGTALFNHANVEIGGALDRRLRWLLVTPDMHRVHHSVEATEHNANFGFNFPFWDRLFNTYVAQPAAGHTGMTIGLTPYQSDAPSRLGWCLALPFR